MSHATVCAAALALLLTSAPVRAGLYSDELAKCLVSATTEQDKTALIRWIFSVSALHPDVSTIANIDADQRDSMNRTAGMLFNRLLLESCRKQTQEAVRYEGPAALQLSFTVLGQVAMGSLMANPAVAQGFGALGKYMDEHKLKALVQPN